MTLGHKYNSNIFLTWVLCLINICWIIIAMSSGSTVFCNHLGNHLEKSKDLRKCFFEENVLITVVLSDLLNWSHLFLISAIGRNKCSRKKLCSNMNTLCDLTMEDQVLYKIWLYCILWSPGFCARESSILFL